MNRVRKFCLVTVIAMMSYGFGAPETVPTAPRFAPDEIALAASLKLPDNPRPPVDVSNRYADNRQAAVLGNKLFFDPRLSADGKTACSSCHRPEHAFADSLRFSKGLGTSLRNAPVLVGSAWSRWFFWDGRSDSQWAQALGPLLNSSEHGLTRTGLAHRIRAHYATEYQTLFGRLPAGLPAQAGPEGNATAQAAWKKLSVSQRAASNRVLANVGKAIAAYERTLTPQPARFDQFAAALAEGRQHEVRRYMSGDEIQGFRLFVGSARCVQCHNGPMFSNYQFHNTGLHESDQPLHMGFLQGLPQARSSEFSCLGKYSDNTQQCPSRFAGTTQNMTPGGFKTPSLRNVSLSAPYMRTGEFATLDEVIAHYDEGSRSNNRPGVIGNELVRLSLTPLERQQLKAFLLTLTPEPAAQGHGS